MQIRVRAVLFDFDGTLADSYPAITASVNHVRARHGMEPLAVEQVRPHVGRGPDHLLRHTIPGVEPQIAVQVYRAHHPSVMHSGTQLLPGTGEALVALKAVGLRLGICSNKPVHFTRDLLRHLDLAHLFDEVLGPEDVPHPKPAPDMILAALDRLDVPAAETLYVGDMTVDIQTARAAGVPVWVVPTGSHDRTILEAAQPDRILDSLAELPALVGPRNRTSP